LTLKREEIYPSEAVSELQGVTTKVDYFSVTTVRFTNYMSFPRQKMAI
jgi:hypothetical protein